MSERIESPTLDARAHFGDGQPETFGRLVCVRCGRDGHVSAGCKWPLLRNDCVRTVADLMDRCFVDEITGCWHWRGARSGGKTPDAKTPSLWLPALKRRTTLGTAICVLLTGEEPKPGVRWHCKCETKGCANPAHRKAGNKSTQMLAAKMKRSPAQCARIAKGKRAASELSDEAAAEIRMSEEPLRVLAARHSISISHASNIRNGKQRRELGARGASVFNLGSQR